MIREPYNLNPYNSTIDTSKVNNFSFTFSGDELGSWNIEIAKNNTSPEIVYTSEEFVPEDVGYTHIYDDDIVEGITLPSTIAHSQGDDGLLRRLYSINGYPFNEAVVKLNVNGIENIGNIKGSTTNGYLVATNYSLGRTGDGVTIIGFDKDGTTIGSQVTDGTYDFLGYLLSVKTNSNIQVGQAVQIEGNSFIIGNIEDAGDGYSELTIVNGEATSSDVTPILTFDSLTEADVTELTVGIEPVQDLNGYDKPWVGGAGKNKLNMDALQIGKAWNGSSSTARAVVYSVCQPNTQYTLSFSGADAFEQVLIVEKTSEDATTNNRLTTVTSPYTFTTSATSGVFGLQFNKTAIASSDFANFKAQIETGSTPTAWQPYSNICPITGHDEVRVTRTGINVWNGTSESGYIDVNTGDPRASDAQSRSLFVEVKPSTQYCYVNEHVSSGVRIAFYDNEKIFCGNFANGNANPQTFTTPANAHYLRFYWGDISKVSINYPSTDHDYHAYQGSTYTTPLGQTVYGGTLDMVTGVLTVDKAIVDLGTLSWWYDSSNNRFNSSGIANLIRDDGSRSTAMLCSAFKVLQNGEAFDRNLDGVVYKGGSDNAILVQDHRYTVESDFETAMNGVTCVYPLATPQTYQLTAQQIKTLVGTNNVWASSGDIVNITFKYNIN